MNCTPFPVTAFSTSRAFFPLSLPAALSRLPAPRLPLQVPPTVYERKRTTIARHRGNDGQATFLPPQQSTVDAFTLPSLLLRLHRFPPGVRPSKEASKSPLHLSSNTYTTDQSKTTAKKDRCIAPSLPSTHPHWPPKSQTPQSETTSDHEPLRSVPPSSEEGTSSSNTPDDTGSSRRNPFSWLHKQLNRIPPDLVGYIILVINFYVYLKWLVGGGETMMMKLRHSEKNTVEGRWWTWFTYAFVHQTPEHLGINMFTLDLLAAGLATSIGSARFLYVFTIGALGASLSTALYALYLEPHLHLNREKPPSVKEGGQGAWATQGASGSIMACVSVFLSLATPDFRPKLFFLIPLSARTFQMIMILDESLGVFTGFNLAARVFGLRIDSAAHLGGIFSGLLFYRFALKGKGFKV